MKVKRLRELMGIKNIDIRLFKNIGDDYDEIQDDPWTYEISCAAIDNGEGHDNPRLKGKFVLVTHHSENEPTNLEELEKGLEDAYDNAEVVVVPVGRDAHFYSVNRELSIYHDLYLLGY